MLNLPLKSICSGLTCWSSSVCGVCLAWAILFSPYPAVLRWGLLGRWEHEPLARAHRHERVLHRVLDFVWRPTFKDPALWRTTRLLSDQKGCRVRFLWEVGRFPMEKTFYLVLDWQTWWVSWCWEYASGHLKSVCVWSTNKLLEKLCCGNASWDVTLSQTWQSVPLDFLLLDGDGDVPPSLGSGLWLLPAAQVCYSQSWNHLARAAGVGVPVAVAGKAVVWHCGAPWGLVPVISLRRKLWLCLQSKLIPDLNNLKLVPANCSQTLMELFPAFLVPEKCPLQIAGCPPWRKDRIWEKLGQEVVYWLYRTTIADWFRIIQKALFFSVSSFF